MCILFQIISFLNGFPSISLGVSSTSSSINLQVLLAHLGRYFQSADWNRIEIAYIQGHQSKDLHEYHTLYLNSECLTSFKPKSSMSCCDDHPNAVHEQFWNSRSLNLTVWIIFLLNISMSLRLVSTLYNKLFRHIWVVEEAQ